MISIATMWTWADDTKNGPSFYVAIQTYRREACTESVSYGWEWPEALPGVSWDAEGMTTDRERPQLLEALFHGHIHECVNIEVQWVPQPLVMHLPREGEALGPDHVWPPTLVDQLGLATRLKRVGTCLKDGNLHPQHTTQVLHNEIVLLAPLNLPHHQQHLPWKISQHLPSSLTNSTCSPRPPTWPQPQSSPANSLTPSPNDLCAHLLTPTSI